MLDKIKLALRISHNALDGEILDVYDAACAELIRMGIPETLAKTNPLCSMAAITYCKWYYASEEDKRDGFMSSFQYQADSIRKSSSLWGDTNV